MPAGLKYVAGGKKATRRHFKGLDIPVNFLYNYERMLIIHINIWLMKSQEPLISLQVSSNIGLATPLSPRDPL
jgi:hypothetical protein